MLFLWLLKVSVDGSFEKSSEILFPSAEVVFFSKNEVYFQSLPIFHMIFRKSRT